MTTLGSAAGRPLPEPTPSSAPFWDSADRGELLVQRCANCTEVNFPPQANCRFCWSEELAWERATGRGRLIGHVVNHRIPTGVPVEPYVTAIVRLEEGVRLLAEVIDVGDDGKAVSTDMAVEVAFGHSGDRSMVPRFRPAPTSR